MVGDDSNNDHYAASWCGACRSRDIRGDVCGFCGRSVVDENADRLRLIEHRRREVEAAASELRHELRVLDDERAELMRAGLPERPPAGRGVGVTGGVRAEWRPEVVSDVLVWLGAALLALAALTFVAVAFTRLSSTGRTVLMGAAAVVPFMIAVLLRRRLPHTADAVYVLAVVFTVIAGSTGRHISGAPHVSGLLWLAVASAIAALANAAVGQWIGFPSARATAAIAFVVSVASTAYTIRGSHALLGSSFAIAAALVVVAAAVARRTQLWRRGPFAVLLAGATLLWVVACGLAVQTVFADHRRDAVAALAVALLGAAPFVARVLQRHFDLAGNGRALVAAAGAAPVGAVIVVISAHAHGDALAVWVALLGAVIVVAAAFRGDDAVALPIVGVGAVCVGTALLASADAVLVALLQPLSWIAHAWTAPAALVVRDHLAPSGEHLTLGRSLLPGVVTLLGGATAFAYGTAHRNTTPGPEIAGGGLTAASLVYMLVASGASAAVIAAVAVLAAAATLLVAIVFEHRGPARVVHAFACATAVCALPVLEMSIAVRSIAIGTTAAATLVFGLVARVSKAALTRTFGVAATVASGLTCIGAVTATRDVTSTTVGLVVSIGAATVILLAGLWRGPEDERVAASVTAHAGVAVGIALCGGTATFVAVAITALAVAHGVGALRWAAYRWLGPVSAVGAVWAWLAAAGVRVPEAYTLPAAAVMLTAGFMAARHDADVSSWITFAPGLLLAFVPTLALTVQNVEPARAVPLTVAALITVIAGARARAQAPLVIGAGTLIALGVDLLGPVAVRWPRWIALAVAGMALLWLGATAERRLRQARAWSQTFSAYR